MQVKIKLIEDGKMPVYAHSTDACCDCYARLCSDHITLPKGTRCLINLGFAIGLSEGYEAIIRPRSGNTKNGIDIGIGTIDADYRGEVKACVINNSAGDFVINNGDRICQMKIQEKMAVDLIQVDELDDTERGSNGFGSTGVN